MLNIKAIKELMERGLVKAKRYETGEFAGLHVLKYTRKVFFDALWNEDPMLEECRGLVLNFETDEIVMRPFQKVYNFLENDTGKDVLMDTPVELVQKINGFMGQVTKHQGRTIYGTTGTLDSDFADMNREMVEAAEPSEDFHGRDAAINRFSPVEGYTYLFEIVHPNDPHIVYEEPGAYLIGIRYNESGNMVNEDVLDKCAAVWGFKRPYRKRCTMAEAIELRKTCRHEGYMVHTLQGEVICKMKSHYYLVKKAMMRMGKKRCALMYNNPKEFKQQIEEEFYGVVDYITAVYTEDEWNGRTPYGRAQVFNAYFAETAEVRF